MSRLTKKQLDYRAKRDEAIKKAQEKRYRYDLERYGKDVADENKLNSLARWRQSYVVWKRPGRDRRVLDMGVALSLARSASEALVAFYDVSEGEAMKSVIYKKGFFFSSAKEGDMIKCNKYEISKMGKTVDLHRYARVPRIPKEWKERKG